MSNPKRLIVCREKILLAKPYFRAGWIIPYDRNLFDLISVFSGDYQKFYVKSETVDSLPRENLFCCPRGEKLESALGVFDFRRGKSSDEKIRERSQNSSMNSVTFGRSLLPDFNGSDHNIKT